MRHQISLIFLVITFLLLGSMLSESDSNCGDKEIEKLKENSTFRDKFIKTVSDKFPEDYAKNVDWWGIFGAGNGSGFGAGICLLLFWIFKESIKKGLKMIWKKLCGKNDSKKEKDVEGAGMKNSTHINKKGDFQNNKIENFVEGNMYVNSPPPPPKKKNKKSRNPDYYKCGPPAREDAGNDAIIIGKSGETIKRIINESGCKIQFKPGEDPNTPDRCATLQGTTDQIARATQMISDLLQRSQNYGVAETFLMHVPANKTGLVIGKGGDTIKQICGEFDAHVKLSEDPPPKASEKIFVIKGSPYQIHHAQHIIRIKVGDIPHGTPVPHFSGSTSSGATAANLYDTGFDGYNQWQQNGASILYTSLAASQTDANQWSNYYQQQQQPQAVSAYTDASVYASGGATATVASTQQQASGGAPVQDYSAQWAEYYRQICMHEKAALVEERAKKQQTSSTSQASGYGTGSYN